MKKTPYKLLKFQNGLNLILKSIPSVNSAFDKGEVTQIENLNNSGLVRPN